MMELSYPYICEFKSEVPKEALSHIDQVILDRLGSSFSELFPKFSGVFGGASRAIDKFWSPPKLALQKGAREWAAYIVVQSETENLFFMLQPDFMEKEGELFDEDYQMLPESWKELYRWFNSFCMTRKDFCPMKWWNTPFRFSARLDLDDFEQEGGLSREETERFVASTGLKRSGLSCLLLTENGDALFVSEDECDGRVFHVNTKDMGAVTELDDPKSSLDMYLEHYLSFGELSRFSFID
ncbi:hypothetical protein [Microbulbifer sp. ALW1]|uniref:hypothetical protein n=1 Tax=Microbulbifer sp. (strain ALW1) TaxID=1516059 RepID=UPI00135BBA3F|nr:hypothetical protein [Microbulbifer sp. ALW1]